MCEIELGTIGLSVQKSELMPRFLSLCLFWKQQLIFATLPVLVQVALATGCTSNKIPLQAKSLRGKFSL